jgi:hypothetical protein
VCQIKVTGGCDGVKEESVWPQFLVVFHKSWLLSLLTSSMCWSRRGEIFTFPTKLLVEHFSFPEGRFVDACPLCHIICGSGCLRAPFILKWTSHINDCFRNHYCLLTGTTTTDIIETIRPTNKGTGVNRDSFRTRKGSLMYGAFLLSCLTSFPFFSSRSNLGPSFLPKQLKNGGLPTSDRASAIRDYSPAYDNQRFGEEVDSMGWSTATLSSAN